MKRQRQKNENKKRIHNKLFFLFKFDSDLCLWLMKWLLKENKWQLAKMTPKTMQKQIKSKKRKVLIRKQGVFSYIFVEHLFMAF